VRVSEDNIKGEILVEIKGLITALVTPFDSQDQLDIHATERLINRLIDNGVDGIFILGTNGEFHVMSTDEKIEFAKEVIRIVNHRVPVYVGTGGISTKETIDLSIKMQALGADALSVITPYFMKLNDQELFKHFKAVAEAVEIPILLYNIPKMTGNPLSVELVSQLAKIHNIKGVKDSSGDIENIKGYIEATNDQDFAVVSGSDSLILPALIAGATGAVAATSNSITKIDKAIFNYYEEGNLDKAQEMQASIEEFRRILKYATVPSVLKYSLSLLGNPVGEARRPVDQVPEEALKDIQTVMKQYKELEENL